MENREGREEFSTLQEEHSLFDWSINSFRMVVYEKFF